MSRPRWIASISTPETYFSPAARARAAVYSVPRVSLWSHTEISSAFRARAMETISAGVSVPSEYME